MFSLEKLDVFRKVYQDLSTGSTRGAIMSIFTMLLMVTLIVMELAQYLKGELRSAIAVNPHYADTMWVYFKISIPKMHCDSLAVELLDYKGHIRQNVDAQVGKTRISGSKVLSMSEEKLHSVGKKLKTDETLGIASALKLTERNFSPILRTKRHVFVNFYAPWCPHCQRLEPTWDAFANSVSKERHFIVTSVDCVQQKNLCSNENIRAYPTLRLYRNTKALTDYQGRRTIDGFETFLQQNLALEPGEHLSPMTDDEGCLINLKAQTYAVPGQIYIGVKNDMNLVPKELANMTHTISWMQFGDNIPFRISRMLPSASRAAFRTLSTKVFTSLNQEQMHRHYVKLVGTVLEKATYSGHDLYSYQYTSTHQTEQVKHHSPEIRISYDMSPTVVRIHNTSQRWYEFFTKLFAIVGGFYTVMSMVDSGINVVVQRRHKDTMGKLS